MRWEFWMYLDEIATGIALFICNTTVRPLYKFSTYCRDKRIDIIAAEDKHVA